MLTTRRRVILNRSSFCRAMLQGKLQVTQHKCRDVDAVTDVVRRGHGGREDGTLTLGGVSTTEHPTSSLSKLRAY